VYPILVHGGGPRITEEMERRGLKANFINGRRVTDEAVLEIALFDGSEAARASVLGCIGARALATPKQLR
jgi:acetylglutamate kinase